MSTAVIYARFSPRPVRKTKTGAVKDCQSIAAQMNACARHCGLHQLHVTGRFQDE